MARHSRIATSIDLEPAAESSQTEGAHVIEATPERRTAQRFLRLATTILFILAFLMLGAGAASLLHTTANDQKDGLLVDALVKSFGDAPSRKRVAVTFSLTNRSALPIRILGATSYCGRHGCLAYDNLPLDIPPFSKRDLVVFAETRAPGEFASDLTLFSDVPGQFQTVLRVNGRVAENNEDSSSRPGSRPL